MILAISYYFSSSEYFIGAGVNLGYINPLLHRLVLDTLCVIPRYEPVSTRTGWVVRASGDPFPAVLGFLSLGSVGVPTDGSDDRCSDRRNGEEGSGHALSSDDFGEEHGKDRSHHEDCRVDDPLRAMGTSDQATSGESMTVYTMSRTPETPIIQRTSPFDDICISSVLLVCSCS